MKDLPPLEYLNECFELDETIPSGLRWRDRKVEHFKNKYGYDGFSVLCAGKQAGNVGNKDYFVVRLDRKRYLVHRIIYALFNGTTDFSSFPVDHIDRNQLNNNPNNLRVVHNSMSAVNRQLCIDARNTHFSKKRQWFYSFRYKKEYYKGFGFSTEVEAYEAMKLHRNQVYDFPVYS